MDEFIYPIEKIFSSDPDGVLEQNDCSTYYIGPYQRGYKWGSASRYEQVPQMLIDIYEAMSLKTSEYFLQYITVKKSTIMGSNVLEVIDGQQRITTLSLLFYRLSHHREESNIAKDKVIYARYLNGVECTNSIFDQVDELDTKRVPPTQAATQDLYYLISAAKCIDTFLDILEKENLLSEYSEYVRKNVLIIVNIESEFVKSEDVFANLNDNKVRLTDTYLIKGLLLTNAIQRDNSNGGKRNYKEILDQRRIMGRTWDEIMTWISNKDVAHYFFGKDNREEGMKCLLEFVYDAIKPARINSENEGETIITRFAEQLDKGSKKETTDAFPLFNKYNDIIKHTSDACKALAQLKHTYRKLRSLCDNYSNSLLYNLLGYVFFSDNIRQGNIWVKEATDTFRQRILTSLIDKGENEFKHELLCITLNLIPDMDKDIDSYKKKEKRTELTEDQIREALSRYNYSATNPSLRNLLLSFSVFPEITNDAFRFDFCQYDSESWSFEHIFPQHPTGRLKIPEIAVPIVCNAINSRITSLDDPETISKLKAIREKISNEDYLEKEDIDAIGFLYECDFDIHQCGNMALLSGGVNSSLSNNPYIAKRPILMSKAISGSFVPSHTMNVFNKSLTGGDKSFVPDLAQWTIDDVTAHMLWQINRNKKIREQIRTQMENDEHR